MMVMVMGCDGPSFPNGLLSRLHTPTSLVRGERDVGDGRAPHGIAARTRTVVFSLNGNIK